MILGNLLLLDFLNLEKGGNNDYFSAIIDGTFLFELLGDGIIVCNNSAQFYRPTPLICM